MRKIVIDGYNLIRQSRTLSEIESQNFEKGREALISQLAAYKRVKKLPIVVVFDAWQTDWAHRSADRREGIEVLYSRSGETADQVILEMIEEKKGEMIVVSSDRGIADVARRRGHLTLSAPEFERAMAQAIAMESSFGEPKEERGGRLSTEKKGPSRRLPKKKRAALRRAKNL